MKNSKPSLFFDVLSYVIGVSLGLFLIVVATWADLEATSYGFERLAPAGLGGLRCPILMTPQQTGAISLTISNTTDRRITPSIKTQISTMVVAEEFLENVELAPGTSKRLEWAVGPENIDLKNFIFAKILMYSSYPLPSQEATCGIFVINLPGNGQVILTVLTLLSLLGMGWGLYSIRRFHAAGSRGARRMGPMVFLAAMMLLGFVLSFSGRWVLSILVMVVIVLTILVLLTMVLLSGQRKSMFD